MEPSQCRRLVNADVARVWVASPNPGLSIAILHMPGGALMKRAMLLSFLLAASLAVVQFASAQADGPGAVVPPTPAVNPPLPIP